MCRFLWTVFLCDCIVNVFCGRLTSITSDNNSRVVAISQGLIRGYRIPGENKVFAFYNVPYATAPLGRNRFQAPLPPPLWSNVFEAVDIGIVCLQGHSPDINLENKTMKEDCLIANIFVPDTKRQNLPVLVYVHGGGFQVGYGNKDKWIDFVKTKDVIVVNFNYRLGILGNLCLGTKGAPGNAALKDQVALLRWVKLNIKHFGGDSDKITLAGCSTGSASVDFLALSMKTEGLFNKIIMNSGCSLNVFAVQQDALKIARVQARKMNISNSNDISVIERSYKTAPVELLTADVFDDMKDSTVVFTPCVEKNDSNSILVDAPYNIFQKHKYPKMPIMYSFTNMEGLLKISKLDTWINQMYDNFSDFLPADLQFVNDKEKELLAQQIKDFYIKDVENYGTIEYIQYFTDIMFIYGILKSVQFRIEAKDNNVYLMEYSFNDSNTPIVPNTSIQGADHCSQLSAVVDEEESILTTDYKVVKETIRNMWANFIKTGEPTRKESKEIHWPAFSQKFGHVLSIKSKMPMLTSLRDLGLEKRFRFWDEIYEKHVRIPIPPYSPKQ